MQAINTKIKRIALLQQLSNLCYIELLNSSKKLIKFFLFLILEIEKQFQFLRNFEYSKSNIQKHLCDKASCFFGIEWGEDGKREKMKNKRFGQRIKEKLVRKREHQRLEVEQINKEKTENLKKKMKNYYRAPE